LNGITLYLPPLRDRNDKANLIAALLRDESGDSGMRIAPEAFQRLLDYHWPGNVRQLRNVLRTAAVLCSNGVIRQSNLPQEIIDAHFETRAPSDGTALIQDGTKTGSALQNAERAALLSELQRMRWNVSRTASALNVSRNTLYRKMHKHGIVVSQ
jgi:sigma-54 dependent transcriptional regulator, acetoin dehydrogenase operon transcriptional activator AcoR